MKDLTEINTTSRDEMVCPNCYHDGLEAHPAFAPDYDNKKAEILKATRCPNEDCKYHSGFKEDGGRKFIQEQYDDSSFLSRVIGSSGSSNSNRSIGSLIINGLIIIGVLAMAASFLGVDLGGIINDGPGGMATVQGEVVTLNGEPASDVTVTLVNESRTVQTNDDGEFVFENVTYGSYSIAAQPPSNTSNETRIGVVEQPITVSSDGVQSQSPIGSAGDVTNGTVSLQFVEVSPQSFKRTIGSGQSVSVSLVSPQNLDAATPLTVSPLNTTKATDTIEVTAGETSSVTIPDGIITDSQIEVTGVPTVQEFSDSYSYSGGAQQFEVYGNLQPNEVLVELTGDATTPTRTVEQEVSSGDTITMNVAGEQTIGGVEVKLSGGQTTAPNSRTGVYTGQNPELSIDSESAPSQSSITLTGAVNTTSQSYTGTVQGTELTHEITGNIPARNVTLQFNGGEPVNSTVANQTISASGEGGDSTEQSTLVGDTANSTYTIDLEHTIQQNSNLVTAGYIINGERHSVEPGTKSVDVTTDKGDSISIWVTGEREDVPTSSYTHDGSLRVVDSEVSQTEISEGEEIGIRATLENPTSSTVYETIPIFKDGEQIQTHRVSLDAGETKRVVFDRTGFSQTGVHSIEVSDGDAMMISVGGAELSYGVGELSADVVRVGDGGTVAVDTTGDGSFDCQVSATNGECSIGTVETGDLTTALSQEGVTETEYTLTYKERYGSKDITVDLDNDGSNEISHSGVLDDGETVSASATLDAGTHDIQITVGNGGSIPYELEWTEAGVVNQPTVTVDGETVIDESGSFKGDRTYTIRELNGGEHTFKFESGSGDPYIAEITWSEQSPETIPSMEVNGEVACEATDFQPSNSCTIPVSLIETGGNTIQFENGAQSFDYTITQKARAVPTQVTATVGNTELTLLRDEAVSERSDGAWTARRSLTSISPGKLNLSVQTHNVTGINTDASTEFSYTYESEQAQNPTVIVSNYKGNSSFEVSSDSLDGDGFLKENATMTIPRKAFAAGVNNISVESANNGSVNINFDAVTTVKSTDSDTNESESQSG